MTEPGSPDRPRPARRPLLRNPRVWLGLLISALAIIYAVRGVDWGELRDALATADYRWLAPGLVVVLAGQLARAIRWQALFGQGPRPNLRASFTILSVGYLVSGLFPLRLGDPVRAWLIETRTPAGGAEALATVLVERVVDFLMIAALVALWIPESGARLLADRFGPGPWSEPTRLGLLACGLVAGVYAVMILVSALGPTAAGWTRRVLHRVGVPAAPAHRLADLVARFAAGFAPLRQPRAAVLSLFWTLTVWLLGALGNWLFLRAFADLPFAAALFVLGTSALFAVLPSSPGYVGVFHSAVILALALFAQVPRATALAYAIVLHAVTIVVLVVLGVLSLWLLGLSTHDLSVRLEGAAGAEAPG